MYLQWPAAPAWLVGYDWTGTPRATVHLRELEGQTDAIGSGVAVAPNGNGFAGGAYTFDRSGNVVYRGAAPTKGNLVTAFSEDGRLRCGVEVATSEVDQNGNGTADFYLVVQAVASAPVRVTRFLHLDAIPGDMGYNVGACSNWLNRALLVRTVCCGVQGALVLRLSDGAVLGTWSRTGGSPVFSPDGQEVADPTWTSDGKTVSTEVRLVLGGTVLARYGAGIEFKAFSASNRLAIVSVGGETQVIEVSTRRVVWQGAAGRTLARVWPRPGSSDVALAFTAPPVQTPCPGSPSSQCTNPLDDVVIVHGDGSSVALAGEFLMPMTWAY